MRSFQSTLVLTMAFALGSCASTRPPDLGDMSFSSEPLLGKAVWHDLITEDLDAAKRFYSLMFGWSLETSTAANGRDYVLAKNGGTYVAGLLEPLPRADGRPVSR